MITFDAITNHSTLIDENDFFRHYFDPDALFRYDSNFFQLMYSPSKEEFKLIEEMQWVFSEENGLNHVKFYWPENLGIRPDTLEYLGDHEYGLEKLELYSIDPSDFSDSPDNSDVRIEVVTSDQLSVFKSINYIEDKETSTSFANAKQPFYDRLFKDESITFLLASYKNQPAGSCILIRSDWGIEIDDLFTLKEYRSKGIATAVQKFIMEEAASFGKKVFLVADAEDTPKEMYIKNGFTYEGFRIGAQKEIKGEK